MNKYFDVFSTSFKNESNFQQIKLFIKFIVIIKVILLTVKNQP